MAWQPFKNLRSGRLHQDDLNSTKFSLDTQVAARWHYSSVYGANTYNNEVDFTPQRITAGGYDGWRVTASPWHYFLGIPDGKTEDGWVGFGGRKGQHSLWFRLLRTGFMRWSDRDWWDIGGAPTYDRADLTRETENVTINTTDETIPVATGATWENVWNTPGGGKIDARWAADGNRLKEEIALNQEGRTWIKDNRNPLDHWPTASLDDIYFGYVFQIDPSDIPRWVKQGALQDIETDFDDDDGQSGLTLENAAQESLAFLPVDDAIVYDDDGLEIDRLRLRKRIYKDSGNYYLLVGARADQLNALPDGILVFDPTIDDQVGASADDTTARNVSDWSNSEGTGYVGEGGGVVNSRMSFRFTNISELSGATISVAYLEPRFTNTGTAAKTTIEAEDAAAPAAPVSRVDFDGRTHTTASVAWDDATSANTWTQSPSIVDVIQELADDYDPNPIQIFWDNDGSADSNYHNVKTYDASSSWGAKLHIEYDAGGTTSTSTTTTTSTSSSTSTSTTIAPVSGGMAFGEQNPNQGETAVSWQTWSDGAAGQPTIIGDADWGKVQLNFNAQGRSRAYDFGDGVERTITITENRYGAGQESADIQIRGQAAKFAQDDVNPAWETYTVPVAKTWRWIQARAINQ